MRASSRSERVICFLTKRSGLDDLKRSLHFLFANFNDRFGYPVLVFHTGDLPHELLDREMAGTLNERQRALLEAHEVKDFMEFPPGYDQKLGPIPNPFYTSRYPGYHQMCAFWFRKVFLQPRMRHVEYYWRFDTDSYLLSDVRYDVFGFAARHNITYGYRARFIETCCAEYMTKFLHMYIDARHLHALVSDELSWVLRQTNATWASGPFRNPPGNLLGVFYNNFEIVHVPSFRDSPLVWDFVESTWRDTILGEYGIYRYRWGDGTLRFQTVYLFPHLYRATHMFCDLHYVHQDRFVASCDFSDSRRDRWPVENQPRTSEFLDLCRAAQHRAPVNCARVVPDWTCPKNFRYA